MKSDMENKEWADDEVSLQRFSKENPFAVPAGYFEEAGQRILSLVKVQGLKTDDEAQGFAVPEGYFDSLSGNIQSRIALEEAVPANQPSFSVPQGYFDELAANIQNHINLEEVTKTRETGFAIPADYFNDMQQQISSRIAVEEILQQPVAFEVPANYFETLNKDILNKTVGREEAIRKTIVRKLWASNTFKYATAACLALVIGAGAFLRNAPAPVEHQKTLLHTQLSQIPADEIKDYLELHLDANDNRQLMENEKQINTDALADDLQDYMDVN
ncbi:hypothetical protein CKK33_17845 [Mucilaginibacter sp. MD40]|uniref:hypothetical protein n=1 Tax=Mucilaginibacter sp. MD40 TaxID=2029590 RepID=UPI000BAC87CD|nr:hypothetical protein [Mucilaginibacter sp. MD40]PAW95262.1 hypothetical protein CKK33_17845 [Mucilaginibacter sp. MD40]